MGSLVSFFPEVEGVGWLVGGGGLEEERGWKYLVQVAKGKKRGKLTERVFLLPFPSLFLYPAVVRGKGLVY